MAGRSLWSDFMLAWLSATNLPPTADPSLPSEMSVSEPSASGDVALLAGSAEDEASAIAPAMAPAKSGL